MGSVAGGSSVGQGVSIVWTGCIYRWGGSIMIPRVADFFIYFEAQVDLFQPPKFWLSQGGSIFCDT